MNRIDRLITKARGRLGSELVLAIVERCGDLWVAAAHLCDRRKNGSPIIRESTHTTMDAAVDHLREIAGDAPIIVDDLG